MGNFFSRKKKIEPPSAQRKAIREGPVVKPAIKQPAIQAPVLDDRGECPPGCIPDPYYVPHHQIGEEPCPGKEHRAVGSRALGEEDQELIVVMPDETEPPYGTGPYQVEEPPVIESPSRTELKKKKPEDACEIRDFASAAKIKRKKGIDPCNPEAEEEKKRVAKAIKDAKNAKAKEEKEALAREAKAAKEAKAKNKEASRSIGKTTPATTAEPCPEPPRTEEQATGGPMPTTPVVKPGEPGPSRPQRAEASRSVGSIPYEEPIAGPSGTEDARAGAAAASATKPEERSDKPAPTKEVEPKSGTKPAAPVGTLEDAQLPLTEAKPRVDPRPSEPPRPSECPPGCMPDPAALPPPPPPEPCPPGCVPDPNLNEPATASRSIAPKDPKQEAKERKERERKFKEEEKKRLDEEKKAKEAEKKRLEEEKKAQEKERKRLEDERKAMEKAEKERLAREAKEAKEKAAREAKEAKERKAREAKEAKERTAREAKEKKEAEAAQKKREEEEKKLKKSTSSASAGRSIVGDYCPIGCVPDPAYQGTPPSPTSNIGNDPECASEPSVQKISNMSENEQVMTITNDTQAATIGDEPKSASEPTVQNINNEPIVGCPPPQESAPPNEPRITPPPPSTPCPPRPPTQVPGQPQPYMAPQPLPPCNCPVCEQQWPKEKGPPPTKDQLMASDYCQRYGYFLGRQQYAPQCEPRAAPASHPNPTPYRYGIPEPVSHMSNTYQTQFSSIHDPTTHTTASNYDSIDMKVHVPECPLQRFNSRYHEGPNTQCAGGPLVPYQYGMVIPIDGTGCCHAPLVTRQVTDFRTRPCQFRGYQNESDSDFEHFIPGGITPLIRQPVVIPGGAVLYFGGSADKPNFRHSRQRTPTIRVKHMSLPKLPYINIQGVSMDDIKPYYGYSREQDSIKLFVNSKNQQNAYQSNCPMHKGQQNYSVMPGDVKNASFAITSAEDSKKEDQNRLDSRVPLVHMDENGRLTIYSKELSNGSVVNRTSVEGKTSSSLPNDSVIGKLEFINFNVDNDERRTSGSIDEQHSFNLDTEDDEMEESIYDEDEDMQGECRDERNDLKFTIEDVEEDDMDINDDWVERNEVFAEPKPIVISDDENDASKWAVASQLPTRVPYERTFKIELDIHEPVTLENNEPGSIDVMNLSSIVDHMTCSVDVDPTDSSESSVVADDGDPTVGFPQAQGFTSKPNQDKLPGLLRLGSWVKNAILPNYKK